MLSDIKFFVKKYLKNPVLVAMLGYIIYKFVNKHIKKESMSESIKVIDAKDDIIYDSKTNKYIVMYDNTVYSADAEGELKNKLKQLRGN